MSATFYVLQNTKLKLEKARKIKADELIDMVKDQILALPQAYAIDFFSLELDGDSELIDEDNLSEDLIKVLDKLDSYNELALTTSFISSRDYVHSDEANTSFMYGPAPADSPLHLAAYLEEAPNQVLATVEYSFLIEDEQGSQDDNSLIYYYGQRDNKTLRGHLEEAQVEEIESFDLSPLNIPVLIDSFKVTDESLELIKNFVDSYDEYNIYEEDLIRNFVVKDDKVYYYLSGPEIATEEELERFIKLTSKLIKDLKQYKDQEGVLAINPIFLDLSSELPRKVRIAFDEEGSHKFYLTGL